MLGAVHSLLVEFRRIGRVQDTPGVLLGLGSAPAHDTPGNDENGIEQSDAAEHRDDDDQALRRAASFRQLLLA